MNKSINNEQGYIALVALLLVAAAGLTIGLTASLAGIDELQVSLGTEQSTRAYGLAQSCIEVGLEELRTDWQSDTLGLSVGADSCTIEIDVIGANAELTALGIVGAYTQRIVVTVDQTLAVQVWEEE